jgi:hypothetical protein
MYARQLAEHYSGAGQQERMPQSGWDHEPRLPRTKKETGLKPNELHDDREYSFFDGNLFCVSHEERSKLISFSLDDLPVIKENIRKGFLETQSKVNTWVQSFKKKLDGEEGEDGQSNVAPRPAQGYGGSQAYGGRRSGEGRRSSDRHRYDADPQVLSDDFSALEMRGSEGMV